MYRCRSLSALFALSLLVGLTSSHADAAPSSANLGGSAPVGRRIANARALDRASFDALADDDVVDVAGKQMSKRAVLAHVKALRDASAPRAQEEGAVEAARAAHAKKEKDAVDAANAPVVAKMAALRVAPVVAAAPAAPAPAGAAAAQPAPAAPKLSGMLGQIKPGSAVILFGSSFGTLEGEVRMYGTSRR